MNTNYSIHKRSFLETSEIIYTVIIAFSSSTGTSSVKICRLLVVAALIKEVVFNNTKIGILPTQYGKWATSFFCICALSIVWTVSSSNVLSNLSTQLYILIVDLILVRSLVKNKQLIVEVMKAVIYGAVMHGLKIYALHGPLVYLFERGGNGVENANTLAYVASIGAIFCYILIQEIQRRNKILFGFMFIVNVLFALLTASKKIFIFLGVFFVAVYILKAKNPLKVIGNLLISAFAVFLVYIAIMKIGFLYSLVGYRFETMIAGFLGLATDGSTGFRLHLIQWGMEWFSVKPMFGYGLDCYKYLLGNTYDTWVGTAGVYAHNNYVELLVDLGLVGTVAYYYIYVSALIKGIKLKKESNYPIYGVAIFIMLAVAEYGQITYSIAFLQEIILLAWIFIDQQQVLDRGKRIE